MKICRKIFVPVNTGANMSLPKCFLFCYFFFCDKLFAMCELRMFGKLSLP